MIKYEVLMGQCAVHTTSRQYINISSITRDTTFYRLPLPGLILSQQTNTSNITLPLTESDRANPKSASLQLH